jgi:ribonuclease PH
VLKARGGGSRADGRRPDEMRSISITRGYLKHAEGSALIEVGGTRVICAATVESRVPPWMRDSGQGWVTAEYSMLPRSTGSRSSRERGSVRGRTHEIERLVGRSLRAVTDLPALGQRTVTLDCDVLQADGGTRTASITGAFVALYDALRALVDRGDLARIPLRDFVAATSVGVVDERVLLDLAYEEDSRAEVDMNLVITRAGLLIEVQGTAEKNPFSTTRLSEMLRVGRAGADALFRMQAHALGVSLAALPAARPVRRTKAAPATPAPTRRRA